MIYGKLLLSLNRAGKQMFLVCYNPTYPTMINSKNMYQ